MSSSTTVVGTAAPSTGYQGGGLARHITSNDLAPTESLIARRRGEADLRERDSHEDGSHGGGLEAGLTPQTVDAAGEKLPPGATGGRKADVAFGEEGEVAAEEWTFPDGGWKAWSVIFGCFLHSCNVQGCAALSVASYKPSH
ncbi:hypothetical protein JCM8208_003914 [Rhodotorula glutinis]